MSDVTAKNLVEVEPTFIRDVRACYLFVWLGGRRDVKTFVGEADMAAWMRRHKAKILTDDVVNARLRTYPMRVPDAPSKARRA